MPCVYSSEFIQDYYREEKKVSKNCDEIKLAAGAILFNFQVFS